VGLGVGERVERAVDAVEPDRAGDERAWIDLAFGEIGRASCRERV